MTDDRYLGVILKDPLSRAGSRRTFGRVSRPEPALLPAELHLSTSPSFSSGPPNLQAAAWGGGEGVGEELRIQWQKLKKL